MDDQCDRVVVIGSGAGAGRLAHPAGAQPLGGDTQFGNTRFPGAALFRPRPRDSTSSTRPSFPGIGAVNPTPTVSADHLRVGDHLVQRPG
ncbi:hypothetical protein ACIRD2_27825 [Streptomyces sp. NPDC093595]|uniref:hypothetical protein n=1 Tax=Streptomyces sp. NPDC093595 TaxID=3366045 RepID=UPI00382948D9